MKHREWVCDLMLELYPCSSVLPDAPIKSCFGMILYLKTKKFAGSESEKEKWIWLFLRCQMHVPNHRSEMKLYTTQKSGSARGVPTYASVIWLALPRVNSNARHATNRIHRCCSHQSIFGMP